MLQSEIIKKLETLPQKLDKIGQLYAEYKATYKSIEDQQKTILSTIKNEIAFDYLPEKITETQLEREARASKKYKQFLFGLNIARQKYLKIEAKLNAIQAEIDTIRSLNSITKSEMNLL